MIGLRAAGQSSLIHRVWLTKNRFVSINKNHHKAGQHIPDFSNRYSMWSHRGDGVWKGFVQVDLDPTQDSAARAILNIHGGTQHE